jgi:hypothetical protein
MRLNFTQSVPVAGRIPLEQGFSGEVGGLQGDTFLIFFPVFGVNAKQRRSFFVHLDCRLWFFCRAGGAGSYPLWRWRCECRWLACFNLENPSAVGHKPLAQKN